MVHRLLRRWLESTSLPESPGRAGVMGELSGGVSLLERVDILPVIPAQAGI